MYQRMLIPLDGSELAECVLPHAKEIAKGCNIGEVVLLGVIEPLSSFTGGSIDFIALQNAGARAAEVEAAERYVAKVQSQLSSEGLNVRSEVLVGRTAETIMEFAEKNAVDIIAIATHGRSGISRWVFGSVANKLLQACHRPMLIIRPAGTESSI